jgi:hypothetical protein
LSFSFADPGSGGLAAALSLAQKVSPKPRRNKATLNRATLEKDTWRPRLFTGETLHSPDGSK